MPNWFIACTKPNAEQYAACALQAPGRDFTVYAPKVLKRIAHAGRVSEVERPFLPRYIFVQDDGRSLRGVRTAPGVSNVMHGCEGMPATVRQLEVDAIRARETRGYVDLDAFLARTDTESFKKGEQLRIVEGPFASFNAIFQERDPHQRVVAFVNIFGQMTRATLDARQVERV